MPAQAVSILPTGTNPQRFKCTAHPHLSTNPKFPISTLLLRENHTPATLARQVQIGIAVIGSETAKMGPKNLPKGSARAILVQYVIRSKEGARSDGLRKERPMKLRIRGNSIRLRLGQSEVARLVKDADLIDDGVQRPEGLIADIVLAQVIP